MAADSLNASDKADIARDGVPSEAVNPEKLHPEDVVEQYRQAHPFFFVMALFSLVNLVAAPIIGLMLSWEVAAIPAMAGILFLTATRRSTARRYTVDPLGYRTPRWPRLSEKLAFNTQWSWWVNISVASLITLVCFHALGSGWRGIAAAIVLNALSATILINAIKLHVKFALDTRFRIVVFRRFRTPDSTMHKAEILPICGLYGQVLLIDDPSLASTWEGGKQRLERWVFSEIYQPLATPENGDHWQRVVETELRYADLVVFDWSGEVTENMEWEALRALDHVPRHRIIMVRSGEEHTVMQLIAQCAEQHELKGVLTLPSPDFEMGRLLFRAGFADRMEALRPERRMAAG